MTRIFPITLVALLMACSEQAPEQNVNPDAPCDEVRFEQIEATITSGDGAGHGPDIGSGEWFSVITFRLGERGNPDLPDAGSNAWCDFVEARLD